MDKKKDRLIAEAIRSSAANVQPLTDSVKAACASIEEKIARMKTIGPDPVILESIRRTSAEATILSSETNAVIAKVAAVART
jgi:hypothetical protein